VAQHGAYFDEDVFESLARRGWEPDAEQDNYDAERRQFETADQKLWYPNAERGLAMPTRGAYPGGWPSGAIVHFTAGRCDRGDPDAEATIRYGSSQQHCYFCISRSGKVYQTAPLNRWGSHAGQSSYPGLGSSVSSKVVGIEICNAGQVKKGVRGYEPWWNKPGDPKNSYYTDAEVRHVERKDNILSVGTYHCYTPKQEASLVELLLWLHAARPDIFKLDFVLGHDEVSPRRKDDPGGSLSMTMPELRALLKARAGQRHQCLVARRCSGRDRCRAGACGIASSRPSRPAGSTIVCPNNLESWIEVVDATPSHVWPVQRPAFPVLG
jgi:N-acetyl-anhydromuramyl-L-alanine amidase AmpD